MNVLVAPDKFKGSLTAAAAAAAIARGMRTVVPDAQVVEVPLADGGEGTAEVLGVPVIEVASTSGLDQRGDALTASSVRTGEALVAALAETSLAVHVAVGGSRSTDGGTGMATVAGWRFLDERGHALPPGGGALRALDRIEARSWPDVPVVGLCDVANPLLGATGSARVFGPQKGATPEDVALLEQGLERLAEVVRRDLDVDVSSAPGTGAGGGIGAGLLAFFGASLVDGFAYVGERLGLSAAIARADVVITGEGRLDHGSREGKVTSGIARMARAAGKRCYAVCGEVALPWDLLRDLGFQAAIDMVSISGRERAFARPEEALEETAARLFLALGA